MHTVTARVRINIVRDRCSTCVLADVDLANGVVETGLHVTLLDLRGA